MIINYIKLGMKNYLNHFSGLPFDCWEGIILNLLESTAGGISFFLAVYFIKYLHFSIEISALMISFYGIGRIIGGFIGGKLSDIISPKLIIIISLSIQACTYSLLTQLQIETYIAIVMVIQGIGVYAFQAANNVAVINLSAKYQKTKIKVINILYSVSNVGLGLSAVIVTIFIGYGFHKLFIFTATVFFISAIYMTVKYLKNKDDNVVVDQKIDNKINVVDTNNRKILTLALICLFFGGLILAQLSTTYSVYIVDKFPETGVRGLGILFTINSIIIILCQTPLINTVSEYNKIMMMGIGAFTLAFGMFILIFPYSFIIAVISCFIYTIGEMLFMTMTQLVSYDYGKKKGQSIGLYHATNALSMVLGPIIGSVIFQRFGGGETLWCICGILGLFCFFACIYYRNYDSSIIKN